MMQAFIEIVQGPFVGKRLEVRANEPLIVGRVSESGLCIPGDPTVSRRHCQINFVPPHWYLTNMSDNGTFLNGRGVLESQLNTGDEIGVGNSSVLRFHLIADAEASPTIVPVANRAPATRDPRKPVGSPYTGKECTSGMVRYTGCGEIPRPAEMARRMAIRTPLYLLVDHKKLGLPVPEGATPQQALYDWLPEEIVVANSPVVVPALSMDIPALFAAGWGQDGILCVQSRKEPGDLMNHLRAATRFNMQGKEGPRGKGLLGYFWPSILEQLLTSQSPLFVGRLLAGIDAVLLESPDSISGWQVFAPPEYDRHFDQMEMYRVPEEKG